MPRMIAIRYERRLIHTGFRVENEGTPDEVTIPTGYMQVSDGTKIPCDIPAALSSGEWTILEEDDD